MLRSNEETVFKCFDDAHSIPKYEIYTYETETFQIRYLAWMLALSAPATQNVGLALKGFAYNNELYNQFSHSFQNITKFNKIKFLIKVLNNYGLMVLVFRLLLLLLLNIMSQTFFLYFLQRL